MKKIHSLVLAASIAAGSAQAQDQSTAPLICEQAQSRTTSALAGTSPTIQCKESPILLANAENLIPALVTDGSYVSGDSVIPDTKKNSQFSLSPTHSAYGKGISATAVLGGDDTAVALDIEGGRGLRRATVSAAHRIGDDITASVTASGATENAGVALGNSAYNQQDINGRYVGVGIDAANVGWLKRIGLSVGTGSTDTTTLGSATTPSTQSRIVDTPTSTQDWVDTYATTTTTQYIGSRWNRVNAEASIDVGTQGELSLRAGVDNNSLMGNRTNSGIGYTHYMGKSGGSVAVNADRVGSQGVYSLDYTKPISENVALNIGVARVSGQIDDTRVRVGLVFSEKLPSYTRPVTNKSIDADTIASANIKNPNYTLSGLGSYGKVTTTVSTPSLVGSEMTGETMKANAPEVTTTTVNFNGGTELGSISLPALNILFGDSIASWQVIMQYTISNSGGGVAQSGTGSLPSSLNPVNISGEFVDTQGFKGSIILEYTDVGGIKRTTTLVNVDAT